MNIVANNNQKVGESLTLECSFITVRGITSRVDIVWSGGGTDLKRISNVNASPTINDNEIYQDTFTIPLLSTNDDGRSIQCETIINTTPLVIAENNIVLDITGEFCVASVLILAN